MLLIPPGVAAGEGDILLNADIQIKYADDCFAAQDYRTAVAEYNRFIYFFPKDDRVPHARFNIGMSLFHLKDYAAALDIFTATLDKEGATTAGIDSGWMISQCYQRSGNYKAAIENLTYLIRLSEDKAVADQAWHRMGWLYLESGEFGEARAAFDRISPSGRTDFDMNALNAQLNGQGTIPQKNPVTAGLLSVVPGGGYLYCERYQDALIAFFFTGAFIYGAVESFDHDLHALGGMMSLVGLGFYSGSMYGGVTSAHKFNQAKKSEFVRELKKKRGVDFSAAAGIRGKEILAGLLVRF
jgi:tetratricopeptide (TPR) repeat protein